MSLFRCDANVEILPCPFCGNDPIIRQWVEYDNCCPPNKTINPQILCTFCGISRPSIELWNKRIYPHEECFYSGGKGCNNRRLKSTYND